MLVVSAYVNNLDMWMINQIKHDRLTIDKLPTYDQLVAPFNKLNVHTATAKVTMALPNEITSVDDAIKYADQYLESYSRLLSFAQDHHVYFSSFACYDPNNEKEEDVGRSWSSMRLGKPWGASIVQSNATEEFLAKAVPLYKDYNYTRMTGLRWAVVMYNESNMTDVAEIILALNVAGLETLANARWDYTKETDPTKTPSWVLSEVQWRELIDCITQKLTEQEIEPTKRNGLASQIGELRDPPIKQKIKTLLQAYNLPEYSETIKAIYEMRNDVLHGKEAKPTYGKLKNYEVAMHCQRLLAKLILKLTDFYLEWPKVHGALANDDLGAVN